MNRVDRSEEFERSGRRLVTDAPGETNKDVIDQFWQELTKELCKEIEHFLDEGEQ